MKAPAILLLVLLVLALVLFLRPRQQALKIEAVNAAAECVVVNPCLYMSCQVRKGPFGGVDPDAGEKDNRRVA